jgi:putative tryptophan/tyrosine transport system substrate-binding protein
MRRREFITILAGTAAWPIAGSAQQAERIRRIGVLMASAENNPQYQTYMAVFRDAFQNLGWAEGRNIQISYRWAAFDAKLMEQFSKELLLLQPDVILSNNTPTTAALLQQTRTIPIVFATVADPVGSGFVAGLARPGGNATGFITAEASLGGKWVELLKEIAPRVSRIAVLFNPTAAPYAEYYLKPIKVAAASFAVEATAALVHDAQEIEPVIATQAREPNSGLIVIPETFTIARRAEIASVATRHRLPAVYPYRLFADAGGLLAYGDDLTDNFRRAASYVDRILKGTKPNELPVQAPVKFELVINMKTAKALGLDVPVHLQQLAEEVIE